MSSAPTKRLRIFVADDHDLVRQGLSALLQREPKWEVCGEAETGPKAVEHVLRARPNIVVVDLELPGFDGLEVTRQIKKKLPDCEVLLFTGTCISDELIRDAFASGAKGVLPKSEAVRFLVTAIESLAIHKPFFTEEASAVMFSRFTHPQTSLKPDQEASDERLSPNEQVLVRLLADGHSNAAVAKKQGVSVRKVENMRAAIMQKLNLNSFADLVRYAARNDIIKI